MSTQPTIGIEIESNWPRWTSASPEFVAAATTLKADDSLLVRVSPAIRPWTAGAIHNVMSWMYGTSKAPVGQLQFQPSWQFYQAQMPEKFWVPAGWNKLTDGSCGMEMKFDGPVKTEEEAHALVAKLCAWFTEVGIDQFEGAGTHIHLGSSPWLDENVTKEISSPLRKRAEAMMLMAFATRERAIFDLMPVTRRQSGHCQSNFAYTATNINGLEISATTPLDVLHNHVLRTATEAGHSTWHRRFGLLPGGCINHYRSHPTMELRFFPGTRSPLMVKGYLRLMLDIWKRATDAIKNEDTLKAIKSGDTSPLLVNPYTYTVEKLLEEASTPWLKKWINATYTNRGEPLTTDIPDETFVQSIPVAA